jgi:hypothetical protein
VASRTAPEAAERELPAVPVLRQVAHDAEQAAQNALRATVVAGNPLSGRQLQERFGLSRAQVAQVRSAVMAESDGHASHGGGAESQHPAGRCLGREEVTINDDLAKADENAALRQWYENHVGPLDS